MMENAKTVIEKLRSEKAAFLNVVAKYPFVNHIIRKLDKQYQKDIEKNPSLKELENSQLWQFANDMLGMEVWFCPEIWNYSYVLKNVTKDDVVFDACAGDLRLSLVLSQICKKVYAVEINPRVMGQALKIIGHNMPNNLTVICANVLGYPLPTDVTVIVLLHQHFLHPLPKEWAGKKLLTTMKSPITYAEELKPSVFTPQDVIEEKCRRDGLEKCPKCETWHLKNDLQEHLDWHRKSGVERERDARNNGWKKTRNREIEYVPQSYVPALVRQINSNGNLREGGFDLWLYGEFVFRKRV